MRLQLNVKKPKPHAKQHKKQQHSASHVKWLESYPTCAKWASQYNVKKLLMQGGGICKLSSLFPQHVAEGILSDLEHVSAEDWNATEADNDYRQNNISHSFKSTRQAPCLQRVIRVLTLLLPDMLHSFSAAKYQKSDHIAPHDDRQYTQVLMEDGSIITCSRDITLVYYLTKDWKQSDGGLLIDLEAPGGPRIYVPEFNSAVLFTVPRWHQVTAMKTDRPRYTLFGWWLVPGKTYKLNTGNEQPPATAEHSNRDSEQHVNAEDDAHSDGHGNAQDMCLQYRDDEIRSQVEQEVKKSEMRTGKDLHGGRAGRCLPVKTKQSAAGQSKGATDKKTYKKTQPGAKVLEKGQQLLPRSLVVEGSKQKKGQQLQLHTALVESSKQVKSEKRRKKGPLITVSAQAGGVHESIQPDLMRVKKRKQALAAGTLLQDGHHHRKAKKRHRVSLPSDT